MAPRSKAATAAPTDAASLPTRAVGSPSTRASVLFRDSPTSTGRPMLQIRASPRSSSRFCPGVLPKPIPGSRQTCSSGIPAATATARRSSRKPATSPTTSSYRGSTCIVRGSPCMCIRQTYAPASAITPASAGSPRNAVTSFTSAAPSPSARRATSDFDVSIETGAPASPSSTGRTRRSSSSRETASAPGRVDSPPMSTSAAPSASSLRRRRHRNRGIDVLATVGEAVGRHVDDTHHRGARPILCERRTSHENVEGR